MRLTLKIWRQADAAAAGEMHTYERRRHLRGHVVPRDARRAQRGLNAEGEEPVAFDSDCREGICGMCGLMINGQAHGPEVTTTCQLHMRSFKDGDTITIEPWRADAFPVLKDLVRRPPAPSTGSSSRAATSRSTPAPRRTRTPRRCPRRTPTAPSTPPPASAAAPASRPAPTARPRCSSAPRSPTSASCRRARPSATARVGHGRPARPRGLRRLHQHRRVHRGLPQGDPARRDLAAQLGPAHRAAARSLTPAPHSEGPGSGDPGPSPSVRTSGSP